MVAYLGERAPSFTKKGQSLPQRPRFNSNLSTAALSIKA